MNERAVLTCRACHWTLDCGPPAMLDWLRSVRMVRRGFQPEPELIGELFRAAAGKFKCPGCGEIGLSVGPAAETNDEDWGMARKCQVCGRPIARERLEVFPNTRLCVACQAGEDRGDRQGPVEYCPRCGNVMSLRPTRGAGMTRYVLACPKCRG